MNANSTGSNGGVADRPIDSGDNDLISARSFLVRALLEWEAEDAPPAWHGYVTDTETGVRQAWRRPSQVARFIERRLRSDLPRGVAAVATGEAAMAGPALTDVVNDMLAMLGDGRLHPVANLPQPNVTLERVRERLVGLGNHRGDEPATGLGTRVLRGGRLDTRVRFQLWGSSVTDVDNAVVALHSALLEDRDELRQTGFLKLTAIDTTPAERIDNLDAWRKAASFDVLYEYQYVDSDDADGLIARILVTTDPERADSPDRELESVVDNMVRWDDESAPPLVVTGPTGVGRLSALVFEAGPAIGGTVTVVRSDGSGSPVTHLPSLAAFLAATSGPTPAATNTDVSLAPGDFFAALGSVADGGLALGDWDTDGTVDQYAAFDHRLAEPIELTGRADRLTVSYAAPPGPASGLDQTAVVYLRVNAP